MMDFPVAVVDLPNGEYGPMVVGKTRAMVYECLCNQNIQEEMELHQIYIPRRNWNQPGKLQITRNYVGTWPEKMKM